MPLLALDVEGTIICNYDMEAEMDNDGRLPAIIAPSLANTLKQFHERGFTIVLATGTDNDNLKYYQREFQKAGIHPFITSYSPKKHDPRDTKADKIRKYNEEYRVSADEIYFFDDAKNNVQAVIDQGYKNAHQVTEINPLEKQLTDLLVRLKRSSTKISKNKPLEKINWDALAPEAKSNIGIYFHLLPASEQRKHGDKTSYWSSLTLQQQQAFISDLKNENSEIREAISDFERSLNNHEEPRPSPEPDPNRYHPQQPQMAHELNEKDLIAIFTKKHNSLSTFSLSSKIEKNPTSLIPIIKNALRTDKNTTTLKALIGLNWMTKDRGLATTAPQVFKDEFNKVNINPKDRPAIKK